MTVTIKSIPLESLADIVMGQSPDSSAINYEEKGLPFLQGCAEFGCTSPIATSYCDPPLRVSKAGSLLISVRAPVGKQNWSDQLYCIGRGLASIRAKSGPEDARFLRYAIEQNSLFLHRRSQGSTFAAVGSKDLDLLPIPEFSSSAREKIGRILATIERAIERAEALIEKYQQIKAGLMHDLFTRGIGADGHLRPPPNERPELYRETPLGLIPVTWDCANLSGKAKPGVPVIRTGPFGSSLKGEHWVKDGVPVITIGSLGDGVFNESELLFVNNVDANRLSAFCLKLGDVVFSRVADVGRSVAISEDNVGWIMSSNLMRISLDPNQVLPQYLQYQLSSDSRIRTQIRRKVNSSGRDVANSEILGSLLFLWPSASEQDAIVRRADAVSQHVQQETEQKKKLEKLKSGLMCDLLTGRMTVETKASELADV